jgi:hypothetical protein
VFKQEFEKEFDGVKRSRKGDAYFFCSLYDEDINLEAMGKHAISQNQSRTKHLNAVNIRNANQTMTAFLPSKSAPSSIDYNVAAAEGYIQYLLLQFIVNYDLTCSEMHKFILDNKKLLNGIMGGEKY